jgi:hypothetical protein
LFHAAAAAAAAAAQVTKEDIEAEKARLAAIDARPIKKVAEAKARKQRRLQVGGWHCRSGQRPIPLAAML